MAQQDLTQDLSKYLDRHLIYPILEFLQDKQMYNGKDILRAQIALFSKTNMIDSTCDMYKELGEDVPAELDARRETVLEKLESALENLRPLLEILCEEDKLSEMLKLKTLDEMCTKYELPADIFDQLFSYAMIQYQVGRYDHTANLLEHYRNVMQYDPDRCDHQKIIHALWGSIGCHILNAEWDQAAEHACKLEESFDQQRLSKHDQVLNRAWLLHWDLFIIFKCEKFGQPAKLTDYFFSDKNLQVQAAACPHLLRYTAAIMILNKRLKPLMKDIVNIVQQESHNYADPITEFLIALYCDLDFDKAQEKLQACRAVFDRDYFLNTFWADFEENARLLIFEAYCRIHECINIKMIAEKLNMKPEEAELWIVKLIQSAKLDAKIDSEKNRVVMARANADVYHQVIEKTKNLSFRSMLLFSNLDSKQQGGAAQAH